MKIQQHSPKADALRRMREAAAEHRSTRASLLAREELAKLAAVPTMKARPAKKGNPRSTKRSKGRHARKIREGEGA